MGRTRPTWSKTGALSTTPAVIALPSDWAALKISSDVLALAQVGDTYAAPAVTAVDGITTISRVGTPTGGTFKLKVLPGRRIEESTADIPYNETAANIRTALGNLGLMDAADITAGGGPLPTDVTLTWGGVWAKVAPEIVPVDSLTGGTDPHTFVRVTTAPKGNGGYIYIGANASEVWDGKAGNSDAPRYLYIASVTGIGNYWLSAYV